jgi:hypothetical protein
VYETYHSLAGVEADIFASTGLTLRNDTPETKAKLEEVCAKYTEGKITYAWSIDDPKTVLVL